MAYLVVENFKRGLDTRRNILTSEAGCLVEMDNAHVTRGGEVEKRKAFKLVGSVGIETYGLEGCGDTVFVFGSAATAQVPPGVTYQRLIHPDGPSFSMTKVVSFTSYAGKPFVIAEFNDGARYCYYNGEVVPDSVNGIYRLSHGNIQGFLEHIESLLPDGYSAVVNGSGITLVGPQGTAFTVNTTVSGKFTASAPTTSQTAVKPIPEVLAKGSFIVSGGSAKPARLVFDGRNMDAASCPGIRSIRVGASSPTADDGLDLIGWSGSLGLKFNTYTPTYTTGSNWGSLLFNIAKAINDNTTAGLAHSYSAYSYLRAYNSGNDTNTMFLYGPDEAGADANGQLVQIEFDDNPHQIYDIATLINPTTIAPSPYNQGKYIATAGNLGVGSWIDMSNVGTTNAITEVKVDGVDILGGHVHWTQSNSNTAQKVADKINSFQSIPEYVASVVNGKVILTASENTGASTNGKIIQITTVGNVAISSVVPMAGGVDPVGGISQRTTVGLATSGTHAETVGSTFRLTIIETENTTYPKYVGSTAMGGLKLNYCFTYKSKVNLLADSYLISSALDDPKDWKPSGIGVFFIDMSNNTNGTEDLVAAAPYQGKLAVFSRSSCQIWAIDVDPQNNALSQVVLNTGTVAPGSVISYGELDVFYLSDSGIRSLKARDSSSQAQVADVGVNIDTIVSEKLSAIPESTIFNTACSVIEPRDNRLIMNVYDKMFVLSSYPTAGIQAWSTYSPEILPVKLMTIKGKMYARYGNSIYLYGGVTGNEYDDSTASMTLPYLDAGKPAHQKHLEGVDLTSDGSWDFYVGTDPYRPEVRDHIGIIDTSTFQLGRVVAVGIGTHIGVRLTSRGSTYGRIGNLVLHFQTNEAD